MKPTLYSCPITFMHGLHHRLYIRFVVWAQHAPLDIVRLYLATNYKFTTRLLVFKVFNCNYSITQRKLHICRGT